MDLPDPTDVAAYDGFEKRIIGGPPTFDRTDCDP